MYNRYLAAAEQTAPETSEPPQSSTFSGLGRTLNAVVTPGGVRIYITHGHRERVGMLSSGIVSQRAYEEHCALAFFGHTHRMMLERENGVWVCNPGSISLPRGGPASYARLTIENGRATLLELVDEDGSLLRKESL